MKKIALILLVLFTTSSLSYAISFPWKSKQNDKEYRAYHHLTNELDLSKSQLNQIKKISIKFEKETIPIQSQIKMLNIDLKEAFLADKADKTKIKQIMKSISEKQNAIELKKIDNLFEIRTILTKKQQDQMQDLHLFSRFLGHNMYERPYKHQSNCDNRSFNKRKR